MKYFKKRAHRRFKTQCYIEKQKRIAQLSGTPKKSDGYYKKHACMDCGQPNCFLCGNPRKNKKTKSRKTLQEIRADIDFNEFL